MHSAYSRLGICILAGILLGCETFAASPIENQIEDGMVRRTLEHNGIEREYFVYAPRSSEPLPVVIGLHGYTSTATGFQAKNGLNQHAKANGYIAVYPQGSHFLTGEPDKQYRVTSWNDLAANYPKNGATPHCLNKRYDYPRPPECSTEEFGRCSWTSCHDDLGFIVRLMEQVEHEFNSDPRRYYLLGVSNGGMMALRLGCTVANRFAAIAPIIAQLAPGHDCGPPTSVPMMHIFGALDDTVRADGQPASDGYIYNSAEQTLSTWAEGISCVNGPEPWNDPEGHSKNLECSAWSQCAVEGHQAISCGDPTGDHRWPYQYVEGISATCVTEEQHESMPGQPRCNPSNGEYVHQGMDLIWSFFSRYQLEESP